MFEQLRRKRMLIEESVGGKHNERDAMSSAQRRRQVEKDLTQYNHLLNKTMQDFRKTAQQLSPFNPNKTFQEKQFVIPQNKAVPNPFIKQKADEVVTPSVKDISPSIEPSSALANEFYELSAEHQSQPSHFSPDKNISNFYKKDPPAPVIVEPFPQVNIETMEQHTQHREREPHIEDEEINLKVPNESKAGSNNSSDAIFFTSHFKEIMNNQMASPLRAATTHPTVEPVSLIQQAQKGEGGEGTGRFQQVLKHNPSGQSLALSNDSSLKYSFNESAIQDIIARKISQELVVDSIHPSGLFRMADGLMVRDNLRDVMEFAKIYSLTLLLQKNSLRNAFLELMVNKEMRAEQKKRQLKAVSFREQRNLNFLYTCFLHWGAFTKTKQEGVQALIDRRQLELKEKYFRNMKVLLFDRRIDKQVNTYYLSKLFTAFHTVTQKEARKMDQKAKRQYFKHLRRRMFQAFVEGCYKSRRESQLNEAAEGCHYYSLLRKHFEAWKTMTPKQQKYVRLAMTTKDQLRETADRRLLQTKTFDFYEVK